MPPSTVDKTETKPRHTPGPWLIASGPSMHHGWPIVSREGQLICRLGWINKRPNSCLIAAAPELLEALKQAEALLGVMFGQEPDATIPETVRTSLGIAVKVGAISREIGAAIAKAEGK